MTKTPLRISIGGGGTDVPAYYQRFGGFLITAAISRHIYIAINNSFSDQYHIKYSQYEKCSQIEEIRHPIVREALRMYPIDPGVEITSSADIPAGTGLGSSGSFTVGLLNALHGYSRQHKTKQALAEEACHLEIDILKQPVGKQDQYAAAFGGLNIMEIDKSGEVKVSPLQISKETMWDLEENMLLFFTGYSRSASDELGKQSKSIQEDDKSMIDNLDQIRSMGWSIKEALEAGDCSKFGSLMNDHWEHKKRRTATMSSSQINDWYEIGRSNGAVGGKLVGAGGGGFLMFYAEDKKRLRKVMKEQKLTEVRFKFDLDGSQLIFREN